MCYPLPATTTLLRTIINHCYMLPTSLFERFHYLSVKTYKLLLTFFTLDFCLIYTASQCFKYAKNKSMKSLPWVITPLSWNFVVEQVFGSQVEITDEFIFFNRHTTIRILCCRYNTSLNWEDDENRNTIIDILDGCTSMVVGVVMLEH